MTETTETAETKETAGADQTTSETTTAAATQTTTGSEQPWYGEVTAKQADIITRNGFENMGSVIDSFAHTQQLVGVKDRDGLMLKPQGNMKDNPEAWEDFRKVVGVPDKPEAYTELPEFTGGVKLKAETIPKLQSLAHEIGLGDQQYTAFIEGGLSLLASEGIATTKAAQDELEKMGATLQSEWGNDYKTNEAAAVSVVTEHADDDFVAFLNESGLADDPRMIKFAHKISTLIGEDTNLPGGDSRGQGQSLVAAQNDYQSHMKKYRDAIFDTNHADHRFATQERDRLSKTVEGIEERVK